MLGITIQGYPEQEYQVNLDQGAYVNNSWVNSNGGFTLASAFVVCSSSGQLSLSTSAETTYDPDGSNWIKKSSTRNLPVTKIRKIR